MMPKADDYMGSAVPILYRRGHDKCTDLLWEWTDALASEGPTSEVTSLAFERWRAANELAYRTATVRVLT